MHIALGLFKPKRSNTKNFLIWGASILATGAATYIIRRSMMKKSILNP